jgi:predicted RND superfamily exporter protein
MHHATRFTLEHPILTGLLLLAVTLGLGLGLPHVRTEFGSRVLIGNDHPAIRKLDAFIARYGGGVPHYIAWECGSGRPCDSVFDDASLQMVDRITTELAPLEVVRRVYSPSNAPVFVADEGGFSIRRFVDGGEIVPDRDHLARLVLEDPTWVGNLVSPDARVGAIVVQPTATDSATDERFVAAILAALEPYESFDFKLVGEAFGNILGGRELAESMTLLVPIMVLLIALVIFLQTLAWQSVVVTLLTLGVALIWTFGLLGWIGWPRDSILEILAPLILIIGVCDSIHLLSQRPRAAEGRPPDEAERREALLAAAREVSAPCALTTLTTSAALLSFATSDLDTFQRFGVMSAFGVAACLVATFTLLPLLSICLPADSRRTRTISRAWDSILEAVAETGERRARTIVVASGSLLLAFSIGWALFLRVDTSREELFGENSRILQWVYFFEANLRPSYTLELDITLPQNSTPSSPAVLAAVGAFSDSIERHPGAGDSRSVLDSLERITKLLLGSSKQRLHDTTGANAELLEILGFDDPDTLAYWLSFDRKHIRVSLDVPEQNLAAGIELLGFVASEAARLLPAGSAIETTGGVVLGIDWVNAVQATQLRSFPTAFLLVFALVSLSLRSLRLGLAALIPAVLPVVVVLGAMGFAGLSLDVGRAMIAAVVLGIAVDDSIHLLHCYRRERASGQQRDEAMRRALLKTGRPIATTSFALALGFMTLTASAWGTVSSFGFFVSLAILVALAAALFVLPALMMAFGRGRARA